MFSELILRQLTGARPDLQQAQKFNPRPPGVLRCESASHAVYEALRANPTRWFNHTQLLQMTGKSTKAVCWALIYLQRQGLIESASDGSRNEKYRIYRLNCSAAAPEVGPGPQTAPLQGSSVGAAVTSAAPATQKTGTKRIASTSMSSREIAKLTGKEHKNVIRDIRATFSELGEDGLKKFERIYLDSRNREQIEYLLDGELKVTLLAHKHGRFLHVKTEREQPHRTGAVACVGGR